MSILGNILTEIKDRVERIKVANGYDMDVCVVSRPTRTGDFDKDHHSVIVSHESPTVNDELSKAGNPPAIAYDVLVKAVGIIRQEIDDEEPIDDMIDSFGENIAKSITCETDWHTFAGNAINATLGPTEAAGDGDDATTGASVAINITYRVRETDPTKLG